MVWKYHVCTIAVVDADFRMIEIESMNILRPRQDGHHFPENIIKCMFLIEN